MIDHLMLFFLCSFWTDEECGSTIYGDLFSNFIAVCHKWTDNWRDRHCDDGMRIQPSVIGIVK
ncbi:unnamed protein product [Brugia timori]|uniref:Secreted protein n=1 Tax=Brugia timori TaxID=42155 RepID=A0A3P7ZQT7_9BILA|nr:unnamed protein product [Brugia timori]